MGWGYAYLVVSSKNSGMLMLGAIGTLEVLIVSKI